MIEFVFVTSVVKWTLGMWALAWNWRVMRVVGVARPNVFYLLASLSILLVAMFLAGGWYGYERAWVIVSCDRTSPVLGTAAGAAINFVYSFAALLAGVSARKIYRSAPYDDMWRVIAGALVVIFAVVLAGGIALRYAFDCPTP